MPLGFCYIVRSCGFVKPIISHFLCLSGATVVLSKLPIGDVATQWFADRGMFCAGRVVEEDLKRTMKACGGSIQVRSEEADEATTLSCWLYVWN